MDTWGCGGGVFAICWSEVGIGFKRLQNPAAGLAVSGCFEHPGGREEQCPFLWNLVCLGEMLPTGGPQAILGETMGLLSLIHCLKHLELVANT